MMQVLRHIVLDNGKWWDLMTHRLALGARSIDL